MGVIAIDQPDFYRLGFASQMIVWAVRKRLHLLARGDSERNVTDVFARAGFTELHSVLMSIVDLLLSGPSNRLQLHAVACPCLSPHEISLLNALAYRQRQRDADARRSLGELFCPGAARLVEPAVAAIVAELDERRLQLTSIEEIDHQAATIPLIERSQAWTLPLARHVTVH
jgi:hypothetical protein